MTTPGAVLSLVRYSLGTGGEALHHHHQTSMAKFIPGPTEQAYDYLAKFTTVSHSCEPASSTRYWITLHCSIEFEEEYGVWVYSNGLRDLAKAFGCKIQYG